MRAVRRALIVPYSPIESLFFRLTDGATLILSRLGTAHMAERSSSAGLDRAWVAETWCRLIDQTKHLMHLLLHALC